MAGATARSPSGVKWRTSSPFTKPCWVMPAFPAPVAMGVRVEIVRVVQAATISGKSPATRRVSRVWLSLLLQRLVDLCLHAIDGAVLDHLAVDEQAWRTAHVDLLPELELGVDLLLHLGGV